MAKKPYPYWLPPPRRRWREHWRRGCGLLLIGALAGIGLGETLVVSRADAADKRGDYATALWWRSNVPLYRRHLGEALVMTSPAKAEPDLLAALRLNPYDPVTIGDLTTVELALGHWPRAVTLTETQQHEMPTSFESYWRMANLFLTKHDLGGFFQQTALACRRALPGYYAAIVPRALSASNNDFARLRQALPQDSVAAASAYLAAAATLDNRAEVEAGAAWLLKLPKPADPAIEQGREAALNAVLATTWRQWPGDVAALEQQLAARGLMPLGKTKGGAPPYLNNPNFDPGQQAALNAIARNGDLAMALGWAVMDNPGAVAQEVVTQDAARASGMEIDFDGTEAFDLEIARQWFLAAGGARVQVTAQARRLGEGSEQGLVLRISRLDGTPVGEVPVTLPTTAEWQASGGTITLPTTPGTAGSGVETWQIALRYHRPSGELPQKSRVLVTAVKIAPVGGSE